VQYVVNRYSSVDWTLLDLFYRITGFKHFRRMVEAAQKGDEGPVCNLSLLTGYLDTYLENNRRIITGEAIEGGLMVRLFFGQYLYSLYCRGESEYENAEDPFPRGRVPFLTIHQSKGLEFPVVILGNLRKDDKGPQPVEAMVAPLLSGKREPIDRISQFDKMRMFYVALSRAMNLLVLAHFESRGNFISEPFLTMLNEDGFPRIKDLDIGTIPAAKLQKDDLPKTYSYTGDYLFYKRCPRNYMFFKKYGFSPSRSQTMLFGSLVHQTIEDLHQFLIAQRSQP
jgi:DNA helicase II / ATP-dependent DNA helicase PcrA